MKILDRIVDGLIRQVGAINDSQFCFDKSHDQMDLQDYNIKGESSKFPKSWTFGTPILKLAVCPLNIHNFNVSIVFRQTEYK